MSDDDVTRYFDAAAALSGLRPSAEDRDAALAAFTVLMQEAALVLAFALPAETEAAPRFTP